MSYNFPHWSLCELKAITRDVDRGMVFRTGWLFGASTNFQPRSRDVIKGAHYICIHRLKEGIAQFTVHVCIQNSGLCYKDIATHGGGNGNSTQLHKRTTMQRVSYIILCIYTAYIHTYIHTCSYTCVHCCHPNYPTTACIFGPI